MHSNRNKHSFTRQLIACILAVAISSSAFASKTGNVIAGVSTINAGKWGIIAVLDPEPVSKTVCGVVTGVWTIIAGGAALYSAVVDQPPQGPPRISAVYEGPAVDRDRTTDEFIPPQGRPVKRAKTMRIVSIVGSNFSWNPKEMKVTFGNLQAEILPLATNTLLMAVVPDSPSSTGVSAPIVVTVNGVSGVPFAFTIDPEVPVPANAIAIKDAALAKERKHLEQMIAFDWKAQALREYPTISDADLASAMVGADQMVRGAKEILANMPILEQGLQQQVTYSGFAQFVVTNPEFDKLTDQSLNEIQ